MFDEPLGRPVGLPDSPFLYLYALTFDPSYVYASN